MFVCLGSVMVSKNLYAKKKFRANLSKIKLLIKFCQFCAQNNTMILTSSLFICKPKILIILKSCYFLWKREVACRFSVLKVAFYDENNNKEMKSNALNWKMSFYLTNLYSSSKRNNNSMVKLPLPVPTQGNVSHKTARNLSSLCDS